MRPERRNSNSRIHPHHKRKNKYILREQLLVRDLSESGSRDLPEVYWKSYHWQSCCNERNFRKDSVSENKQPYRIEGSIFLYVDMQDFYKEVYQLCRHSSVPRIQYSQ